MSDKLSIEKLTVNVSAFGEVREVEARVFTWSSETRGVYSSRIDTDEVFAGRLRTGQKLWKVYGHIKLSQTEPGVYVLTTRATTILNRNGAIVGWWKEKYEPVKSQHNSAVQ